MLAAPASLACKRLCTLRTQATTGQPIQPAFPAQWFYGLYVISSVRRAFWPPSPRVKSPGVDPSVGQGYRIWPIACKRNASSQPARLILRRIEA
jgi:hypothetical protein